MSKSWQDKFIDKIVCGDCLELMQEIPSGSVDLVLTDPPYGIGEARRKNQSRSVLAQSKAYPVEAWDDKPPTQEEFDEIRRVSKNQIIFGANHFSDRLPASPCWLVWDKDNGNNDFADCELIWTSFASAVRYFKWRWHGMIQESGAGYTKAKETRYHRNQKPVGLIIQILDRYCRVGETVLDCYTGSGSICVAAKHTERHYIGIDISEKYCEIARKRIEAAEQGITVNELEKGQKVLF